MNKKKLAVLLSSYNGEHYIREQINSILDQVGDFEIDIFVRDDGSTDSTLDILKEYKKNKKLTYMVGNNVKTAKSFLMLLNNVKDYDYYAFSDQDDYWFKDKLDKEIKVLEKLKNPSIVFSNGIITDKTLKEYKRNIYRNIPPTDFKSVLCGAGIQGCTMVFNNCLAKIIQNSKIPEKVVMHDSFISRVCLSIGGKILFINQPLILYRQHANNVFGVPTNKINALKDRIKSVLSKDEVSISDEAREIITNYSNYINKERYDFLNLVCNYNKSLTNRLKIILDKEIKYISTNKAIEIKTKILLGNR